MAAAIATKQQAEWLEKGLDICTDLPSVREAIDLPQALYDAGRMTWDEFFFHALVPAEDLHDHRMLHGHYKTKLAPIEEKIQEVERRHGLLPGQFWLRGEAPEEYESLSARWSKIVDGEFGKLLQQIGLTAHARLWRSNREEFRQLREAGRASVFETADDEHATVKLVKLFEREAKKCANAKAYYAACVMLGSASEARILLKCLHEPGNLAAAKLKVAKSIGLHKEGPHRWNLGQLLEVAKAAGWISDLETQRAVVNIENLVRLLADTRNLVHAGNHARNRPHVSIGRSEYEDARAAYLALRFSIERTLGRA